jgi:hypothetical protein
MFRAALFGIRALDLLTTLQLKHYALTTSRQAKHFIQHLPRERPHPKCKCLTTLSQSHMFFSSVRTTAPVHKWPKRYCAT